MDRRLRTNLLLAAVVVVIGAFIWLAPKPRPTAGTFAPFDTGEPLTRIEVRKGSDVHFALQSGNGSWNVTAPFRLPADDFQVNALLDSLRQPATSRYPAAEANLAELGLEQPRWSVQVNGQEVLVGDRAALGNDRYLLKDGFVYLVSDVLSYRLQRNPLDYASRRPLPEALEIVSITLPSGVRVARSGIAWELHPDDPAITTDALQSLFGAWRNATAMKVTGADSVPRDGQVLVTLDGGTELRFGVETRDDGLRLTRADPAVTYFFPPAAAEELLQLPRSVERQE